MATDAPKSARRRAPRSDAPASVEDEAVQSDASDDEAQEVPAQASQDAPADAPAVNDADGDGVPDEDGPIIAGAGTFDKAYIVSRASMFFPGVPGYEVEGALNSLSAQVTMDEAQSAVTRFRNPNTPLEG